MYAIIVHDLWITCKALNLHFLEIKLGWIAQAGDGERDSVIRLGELRVIAVDERAAEVRAIKAG
jgi:hypothetical protein